MATDHFENDIELDDEIGETDDLDLDVLEGDEDVAFDDTDFDIESEDEEDEAEGEGEGDEDAGAGAAEEEEEEEEEDVVEPAEVGDQDEDEDEEDEDVIVEEEEDEEEDEETLEVLLGPDSDAAVTPPRSRSDESGDAPPGEGEFTCRSCFLVKRRAQLADADAMICLDCA